MSEGSLDLDGLKSKLGVEWEPWSYPIERGMVRRFARAVGDPNPRWQEGSVAPPTFVLAIGFEQFVDEVTSLVPFGTVLMGGTELECYQPIKPGDVITVVFKISSLRERQGKMGKMAFMTFDSTYKNQGEELVARCRQMVIGY
jgi:acyl dehydratase